MAIFTDQLGRKLHLSQTPKKIISLVPSQTELLHDLGLDEEVIGITKFCVHPDKWFRIKTRVGGTKQLHIEKIKELKPDLIIANKEENVKEQIEELEKYFPVWISDVNNLEEALKMIRDIGKIVNKQNESEKLVQQIQSRFTQLSIPNFKLKTCYLIWKDPYMTIGGNTFISNMMKHAGFENMFEYKTRYPEVTIAELQIANCQLLFLSSEPYPFAQKNIDELQTQLPNTKIILVDGEMFSWYGSHLIKAPKYFMQLQQTPSL